MKKEKKKKNGDMMYYDCMCCCVYMIMMPFLAVYLRVVAIKLFLCTLPYLVCFKCVIRKKKCNLAYCYCIGGGVCMCTRV